MWKALRNSRLAGARDRSASPRDAGAEASGTGGVIKEPPMEIIGKCLTADEFVAYVEQLSIPEPRPTRVFLHHTWKPTPETWHGYDTILAMKSYYERQPWTDLDGREHEGWTVGPHVFVAPDGIWLFSDLRYDGVGVYGHNYRSRHVEMVGNYDPAPPSGSILAIYARENGQGMVFELEAPDAEVEAEEQGAEPTPEPPRPSGRPSLKVVK